MTLGRFRWLAVLAILVLAVSRSGLAQDVPAHFSGLINDHTVPGAGSWELHGVWTLDIRGESGKADFTAALTMERSDYFFLVPPGGDPSKLAARNAHTHHIAVTAGLVTFIPNGFRVIGPATVTANGATPTTFGTNSTLQVDVTGGNLVMYSNIALTFSGDAVTHFGSEPLAGVASAMRRNE
jgi:hypothetical protein